MGTGPWGGPQAQQEWWHNPERLKAAKLLVKKKWTLAFDVMSADSAHINVKELRASRMYVRRRVRESYRSGTRARVIILSDSRAAVGALSHGRSPSPIFNNGLRLMLPQLLGTGLSANFLWVPSESNPADAPSRHRPLWTWRRSVERAIDCARSWTRKVGRAKTAIRSKPSHVGQREDGSSDSEESQQSLELC